jgi:hypothetical protein
MTDVTPTNKEKTMLKKKGRDRLLKLADFLENQDQKHFNMWNWFRHIGQDGHKHDFGSKLTEKTLTHCGTAACALGWAATMPFAKKDGVCYVPERGFKIGKRIVFGEQASNRLFGLNVEQHYNLFERWEPGTETDPKAWAKRCRRFVKEWS